MFSNNLRPRGLPVKNRLQSTIITGGGGGGGGMSISIAMFNYIRIEEMHEQLCKNLKKDGQLPNSS